MSAVVAVISAACVAAFTPIKSTIGDFVSEHILGDEPLVISVDSNTDQFNFNGGAVTNSYYFTSPFGRIPQPPVGTDDCTGRYAWAHSLGGIDDGATYAQFSIYSRTKPVTILGAQVRIVKTFQVQAGTVIGCESGGEITVRHLEINLNKRTLLFDPGNHVMSPFALDIQPGQTEVVQLVAWPIVDRLGYEWVIDLFAQVDGRNETLTVDNHGVPFETVQDFSDPLWMRQQGVWTDVIGPGN